MATGYTHDIAKGITFEQFALGCARAFGACVLMRDDPQSTPIPEEFNPSEYHLEQLGKYVPRLAELEEMTPEEAFIESNQEYDKEVKQRNDSLKKNKKLMQQYETMLDEVNAWKPPTPDHQGLKDFMIQQIESSIEHDDMGSYYREHSPVLLSGEEWLEKERDNAQWQIDYHTKENRKEVEIAADRTQWVKDLRGSL